MSSLQITVMAVSAVLVFWAVGAYNRLMRLRNIVQQGFDPVHQQLRLRHELLQRQIETLRATLPECAATLSALQAAAAQLQAASAHARAFPAASSALDSLRLAEVILLDTRARLPALEPADTDLAALSHELAAVEVALKMARAQFNDAVMEYNHAVRQFPTWLLAGLFAFRVAGRF